MPESINTELIDRIDAILPQTQCTKCGYPGCRPYAEAIAAGNADINLCPPGGIEGIRELATLLGMAFKPYAADVILKPRSVAFIDESLCIGCTLCLQACPVDAIAGAAKQMHTIIALECTGCELCVSPCPVDCIAMNPLPPSSQFPNKQQSHAAKQRYQFHLERIERNKREKADKLNHIATPATDAQALIQAAMERAKSQAAGVQPRNMQQLTEVQLAQITQIEARRAKAELKAVSPKE
jgi:Na+-translocating ferredoxin:NAD+ oxidoreductase subunit B